jgi:hypothetical protein
MPGSVTPARRRPPNSSTARYQMLGTAWPRCMSLARRAPPAAVWVAGHGEGVGAGGELRIGLRKRERLRPDPTMAGERLPGAGRGRCCAQLGGPEVEGPRSGHGGQRGGGAVERGIVGRDQRGKERERLRAVGVAEGHERALVQARFLLEVDRHGVVDQQAVLHLPGLGGLAQHEVFEWGGAERAQPGVHSGGVGVEDPALLRAEPGEHRLREPAETVQPHPSIAWHGLPAEERREFPGGRAPQKIHLEEAILGVQPAEGAGDVGAVAAAYRGHAQGVALDRHLRGETGDPGGAVELRQAGAEALVTPSPGERGDGQQEAGDDGGETEAGAGGRTHATQLESCAPAAQGARRPYWPRAAVSGLSGRRRESPSGL